MRKSQYFVVNSNEAFVYDNDLPDYHFPRLPDKDRWSQILDQQLRESVSNANTSNQAEVNWELIAEQITKRRNDILLVPQKVKRSKPSTLSSSSAPFTVRECFQRYNNVLAPTINKSQWKKSEEEELKKLVEKYDEHNWVAIAAELGTQRTPFECLRHYQRHINTTKLYKNNEDWTPEEDQQLLNLIEEYGIGNWRNISAHMDGR